MGEIIGISKNAKIRELIAQLDQALEMAKDLNAQLAQIDCILEEKPPSRLAA